MARTKWITDKGATFTAGEWGGLLLDQIKAWKPGKVDG